VSHVLVSHVLVSHALVSHVLVSQAAGVLLDRPSTLYNPQDHGDNRYNEQDVDQAANVIAHEADSPKDKENDCDDVEEAAHGCSLAKVFEVKDAS